MTKLTTADRLEILRLSTTIAEGESSAKVVYVDVGILSKEEARDYITKLRVDTQQAPQSLKREYWIPRREGGHGTRIEVLPGAPNLEDVLNIADKLVKFCGCVS